ncbi:hypothetical protein QY049_04140 [Bradyrhizobium sp. WYCCWR 13022]|uniref:hypothetical protein n=1 Tax=unclassified Bradyrhizobium TaxID=2631580 RepID=UPI00263A7E51|nr:hypothetical protein [Bradyrhizobium sp. WYCCWR 13022]MDN4982413.1 hypothetical protein [Bradyrhizobium sp. WYCCWR 13022]
MLIKTLTLHSLTYLVGISSSIAVHQNAHWSSAETPNHTHETVFRAGKSDRLPTRPTGPHARDLRPALAPAIIKPNFKVRDACKAPIDVPGRCFASVTLNNQVG